MTDKRTLREIYRELVSTPFFPLLFIAEAVKTASVAFFSIEPVFVYTALAVVATVLWVFSDSVDVDVDTDGIVGD